MKYLEKLRLRHRELDRLIDRTKNAARQDELKRLKRIRLALRDRIASLSSQARATSSS